MDSALMEGGSVHDLIRRNKKVPCREEMRIALDVPEGLMFMNSHGVSYKDLNMAAALECWLPWGHGRCFFLHQCRGESVTETSMSNVYSIGMVLWEMVTGESAFSSYSPVQAAVGIASCGFRPDIPKDCPPILRSLMIRCWNNCPSKRPLLPEIVSILLKQNIS